MMKRKETVLLVENWRRHLAGKKPVGKPINEIFGLGKKVNIKAMISNRLEKTKKEINDAVQDLIAGDENSTSYDPVRVLNDLVHGYHINIVRGQALLFLAKCLDKHDDRKIKGKFTEDMLDDLVAGNTKQRNSFDNVIKSNVRFLNGFFNKNFDCSSCNDNVIRARSKWAKLDDLFYDHNNDSVGNFLNNENLYKIVEWMIDNNS